MLVNTGNKRGSLVFVEKYINDVLEIGYPKQYNALLSFPGYSAITLSDVGQMSASQYKARMDAFEIYVEGEESGSNFINNLQAGFERIIQDEGLCPIEYYPIITDFSEINNSITWTMLDGSETLGNWILEWSLDKSNWNQIYGGGGIIIDVLPSGTYNLDIYFRIKRISAPFSNYSYLLIKNVTVI